MGKWSNYLKTGKKRRNPVPHFVLRPNLKNVVKMMTSINADVAREGIKQLVQFFGSTDIPHLQWQKIKERLRALASTDSEVYSLPILAQQALVHFKDLRTMNKSRKNPVGKLRKKVFKHRHYGEL